MLSFLQNLHFVFIENHILGNSVYLVQALGGALRAPQCVKLIAARGNAHKIEINLTIA
jgi:hypothetical protein